MKGEVNVLYSYLLSYQMEQWCQWNMIMWFVWVWSFLKNKGCKQTKCKTCIYWTTNTLSKLHTSPSQCPPKFCSETSKEIAFFIIQKLEVFRGLNHFDLTLLSPLTSLLKAFRPIQITLSNFLGHHLLHLTRQKTGI